MSTPLYSAIIWTLCILLACTLWMAYVEAHDSPEPINYLDLAFCAEEHAPAGSSFEEEARALKFCIEVDSRIPDG